MEFYRVKKKSSKNGKVRAEVLCESRVDKWRVLKIQFKNCPFLFLLLMLPLLLLLWLGTNLSSNPILMSLMFMFCLLIFSLSLYGLTQNRYLVTEKGIADVSSRSIVLWEEIESFEIKEDVILVFRRQRRFCNFPILLDGSEEAIQTLSRKIN